MTFTIVGRTQFLESCSIIPHSPVTVAKLHPGDIVYYPGGDNVPSQWYRVYDSGNKGLRFWGVTGAYAEAVATMQAEIEKLARAKYDAANEPQGNNGEPLITSEWQPGDDWRAEQAEEAAYMHSHPGNGWGL
jgi:hypothetical protein